MSDFVTVSVRRTTRWLAIAATGLIVVHILLQIAFDPQERSTLVNLFNVGLERNVPTFYASFLWVLAALLTALTAKFVKGENSADARYWWGLTLCFIGISIDEFVGIHERLIGPVRAMLDTSGPLFYAWVIPYSILTLGFALLYTRFLMRLPRRTAALFVAAGAIFVAGAVGFEMLSGWTLDAFHGGDYANRGPLYIALQTIEEAFEFAGVITFVFACLDHGQAIGLSMRVGDRVSGGASPSEKEDKRQSSNELAEAAAAAAEQLMTEAGAKAISQPKS